MDPTRRALLASLIALAALPLPQAGATPPSDPVPTARAVQDALLSFDLRTVLRRAREELGLPARFDALVEEILGDAPPGGGLRRLQQIGEDPEVQRRLRAVMDRERKRLRTKLMVRRAVRGLPERTAELGPWIERLCAWLGLDLPAMRAATADLPPGLLVVVGPATDAAELGAMLAREPFVRFLELVHGRRARVWLPSSSQRELLVHLLDPEVRVVCTVGHGTWTALSLDGVAGSAEDAYRRVRSRLRDDPATFVPRLLDGNLWGFGVPWRSGSLEEADLDALLTAWLPDPADRAAVLKDRVVRHTCGSARWEVEPALARTLLPLASEGEPAVLDTHGGGLSPATPLTPDAHWQRALTEWTAGRDVQLVEQAPFGTCLVRDPSDTRGYDGISWIPDFVEHPVPEPHVPWPPRGPPAGEPG